MFIIPAILVVLNILFIVYYYYLTKIDHRNAVKEAERLRDELRDMDRKLICGYWKYRYPVNE